MGRWGIILTLLAVLLCPVEAVSGTWLNGVEFENASPAFQCAVAGGFYEGMKAGFVGVHQDDAAEALTECLADQSPCHMAASANRFMRRNPDSRSWGIGSVIASAFNEECKPK